MRSEGSEPDTYTKEMMIQDMHSETKLMSERVWYAPKQMLNLFNRKWQWDAEKVYRSRIVPMPTKLEARLIGDEMKKRWDVTEFPEEFEDGIFIRNNKSYIQPVWDGRRIVGLKRKNY